MRTIMAPSPRERRQRYPDLGPDWPVAAGLCQHLCQGIPGQGPDHPGGEGREASRGQQVIHAHPSGSGGRPVDRRPAAARRPGPGIGEARVGQEGVDRLPPPVAAGRVEVGTAQQNEIPIRRGNGQAVIQQVPPQHHLVMVAPAVPVPGAVEHRGAGVKGQQVQPPPARQHDRHDPVPVRRQALDRGQRIRPDQAVRHIRPEQARQAGDPVRQNGISRQNRQTATARKAAIGLHRAGRAGAAQRDTGIGGEGRNGGIRRVKRPVQGRNGGGPGVVIQPREHQDIRP